MTGFFNIALVALLASYGTEAVSNFRGSEQLEAHAIQMQVPAATGGLDYVSLGMGAGIGVVVAVIIAVVVMKVMGGKKEEPEEEKPEWMTLVEEEETPAEETASIGEEEPEPVDELPASKATDYQELLKMLAKKVAQEVGPKLSKGGAVKNVLDSRMTSFTDKAKSFLMSEMNGTAGAVLNELEAPEAMMLLDWNHAVEANFPPASILVAGVLSPTMLTLMSVHHLIQMLVVGLPILCLCIAALWIDWAAPCSIPTIFTWLFAQSILAACLVLGHLALFVQTAMGKKALSAKAEEVQNQSSGEDAKEMLDQFVGNTMILQEALLIENNIRKSFWNTIVGVATFAWVLTTIWNLVLICGWTFVPGIVAFHPDAAEVAKEHYCGAWMTVIVLRVNILLAVLFLFFNLATVVQWFCDMMIDSQGFQENVLNQAREMDRKGSGLPVVELLVKAFLLRGGSDTLNSRLGVIQARKYAMEKEQAQLMAQAAALESEIGSCNTTEDGLKQEAAAKGGEIHEAFMKLDAHKSKFEEGMEQFEKNAQLAQEEADRIRAECEEKLEELWVQISKVIDQAQKMYAETMETLQDPEFQQHLLDSAKAAQAQAQEFAAQAAAMAADPELQKKLNKAMHDAMEQAEAAAKEIQEAANDPEKRRQLQEKAQKLADEAKEAAMKAAEQVTDPKLQEEMKASARKAMEQAKVAAESAVAALQDPEKMAALKKDLENAAQQAFDEVKAAEKKLEEAVNDPELKAKMEAELEKAKAAAKEKAKEAYRNAQEMKKQAAVQEKLAAAAKKFNADK